MRSLEEWYNFIVVLGLQINEYLVPISKGKNSKGKNLKGTKMYLDTQWGWYWALVIMTPNKLNELNQIPCVSRVRTKNGHPERW